MKIGIVFPQLEIEPDREAVRLLGQAIEESPFDHLLLYDHVVGTDPSRHPGWEEQARRDGATRPKLYDLQDNFHEVMVLMGFLAATTSLELATGVLVAPQRQTALVAKQSAQVDILTGGRLRLGMGIGWNRVEYQALGMDFDDRAERLERQIEQLRSLWTQEAIDEPVADDMGVRGVGLVPRPIQRPIPIWLAAGPSPRALRRVGRLADGWIPLGTDASTLYEARQTIAEAAIAAGRSPDRIGIQARVPVRTNDLESLAATVDVWRDLGATHVAFDFMGCDLDGADAHAEAITEAAAVLERTDHQVCESIAPTA